MSYFITREKVLFYRRTVSPSPFASFFPELLSSSNEGQRGPWEQRMAWFGFCDFHWRKMWHTAFIFKLPQPLVIHRYFSPHSRANDLWHLGSPQRRDFELTEFSLSSTQFQDNLKFLLLELWPTHPSSGASWWYWLLHRWVEELNQQKKSKTKERRHCKEKGAWSVTNKHWGGFFTWFVKCL